MNAHTDADSRTNVADTHGPATYPATPPELFGAGENTTGPPPGCHTVTSPADGASTCTRDDQFHDHPGPNDPDDPDNNEL